MDNEQKPSSVLPMKFITFTRTDHFYSGYDIVCGFADRMYSPDLIWKAAGTN